jgi:hypothetical protein
MTDPAFRLAAQEFDPAIPVASLAEHPDNPNKGDTEVIAESLDAHGFYGAVLAQRSTGRVLAGNHRLRTAVAKGATTLPGFWLDVDDGEAEAIMAADNESTRRGGYDEGKLLALLQRRSASSQGLFGTGFTDARLEDLLHKWQPDPLNGQEGDYQGQGGAGWNDPDQPGGNRGPAGPPLGARGIRDIILALPNDQADRLAAAVRALRHEWDADMTQGEVLLRAAELAVEGLEGR